MYLLAFHLSSLEKMIYSNLDFFFDELCEYFLDFGYSPLSDIWFTNILFHRICFALWYCKYQVAFANEMLGGVGGVPCKEMNKQKP